MESNEKKYSNFIGDLKSSNIASNITSLNFCSEQIGLLLDQIKPKDNNLIINTNIEKSRSVIEKARNSNTDDLSNEYVKFGDNFISILDDLKNDSDNLKYLKKIAIHYLDVAKLTKDERIKNLSFSIADELTE